MDLGSGGEQFWERFATPAPEPERSPTETIEFYKVALAGAEVGTWQLDTFDSIMSWDAVTSAIFGLEPVPVARGYLAIHEDDHDWVLDKLVGCISDGSPFEVVCRAKHPNGETRWIHSRANRVTPTGKPSRYLSGTVTDITDTKLADDRLRQAEERYRLVSRATMDWIYDWDLRSNRLTLNDGLGSRFGYRSEEIDTIELLVEKLHPDEREQIEAEARGCFTGNTQTFGHEHRFRRSDGSYAYVYSFGHVVRDPAGKPVRVIGAIQDLSERKSLNAALYASEALNRSIVEASTDCVKLLDLDGKLEFMNARGAESLGLDDPAQLYGTYWADLWPHPACEEATAAVASAAAGGIGRFSEACPTMNGELKWWDVVVSPVLGDRGTPIRLVAISRDVTERHEVEQQLLRAASRDALTDLPNRAYFQTALTEAVSRAHKNRAQVALMMLDLDDFKQVNDSLGHDAGDALLQSFAHRLADASQENTLVARLGGDEFAVLIENVGGRADLEQRIQDILQRLRNPFVHGGRILDCHATIGAALLPDHGESPAELMKSADIALYVAKAECRGTATVFQAAHRDELQQRLSMLSLARSAIREQRIVPFYQPKVKLSDNRIYGFEALLRWNHPGQGIQMPSTIEAAFEDLDIAAAISDNIIDQVLRDMRCWLDDGLEFGHVAVNAAAAEFRRGDFAETILERLEKYGIPPQCFQLEVTETVFLGRGAEYVDRALKLLSASGVAIALDDFGTGYASLRHLKQFPVDVIKIDQSFVRDMDADPEDAAIIEAVLNLGRSLKISVVAEGIETREQEQRLRGFGCRYGQGFLYSQAVPAHLVALLLGERPRRPAARQRSKAA